MGCINYGTTPIEVEYKYTDLNGKEQANLDTEKQEPCDEIEEPCDEIENLKES